MRISALLKIIMIHSNNHIVRKHIIRNNILSLFGPLRGSLIDTDQSGTHAKVLLNLQIPSWCFACDFIMMNTLLDGVYNSMEQDPADLTGNKPTAEPSADPSAGPSADPSADPAADPCYSATPVRQVTISPTSSRRGHKKATSSRRSISNGARRTGRPSFSRTPPYLLLPLRRV